jgi:hypothetical protein
MTLIRPSSGSRPWALSSRAKPSRFLVEADSTSLIQTAMNWQFGVATPLEKASNQQASSWPVTAFREGR